MSVEVLEEEATKAIFDVKFNGLEYIRTYYPDITDVEILLTIMYLLHTNADGNYVIDSISRKTLAQREVIENIAIFDFYREVVERFLREFPLGDIRVLDIGGGPTIYQHIGLSLVASHITHAEFLESNRAEVISWLREEDRAHNWDTYFMLVQELFKYGHIPTIISDQISSGDERIKSHALLIENALKSSTAEAFKDLVRACIGGDVVHCDMFQDGLGLTETSAPYHVVTSNFVAESAAQSLRQWEQGVRNMLSLVAPGGYFVQTAIKNATWYQVGTERLPAVAVSQEMINEKFEKQGFEIIYEKVLEGSAADVVGYDGMIFTLARKAGA